MQVVHRRSGEPLHILVDSTGLKVYVDSEWRKHSSRRLWRKLHLVVDAQTGDILASALTTNKEGGCFQVPILLAQIDEAISSMSGDGAYDTQLVYDSLENRQTGESVGVLIPPRRRARRSGSGAIASADRDRQIQFIEEHGRRRWQKESGFNDVTWWRRRCIDTRRSSVGAYVLGVYRVNAPRRKWPARYSTG